MEGLKKSLDKNEYVNTDFEPRLLNIVFQEWFSKHGTSPRYFLLILLGLTATYVMLMKREEYILFSTGLVTMGVEMLVVFGFQIIYGYIYLKIGAIVTAFLLGLLPGAIFGRVLGGREPVKLVISDLFILILLLVFFIWVAFLRNEPPPFYFFLYGFIFSLLCGFQFPVAARMIGEERSPAASCLAADLTGASVGTLVTGTLLIPLWGIRVAVIFLILVKITSSMIIAVRRPVRS
jgi:spermidine synthase